MWQVILLTSYVLINPNVRNTCLHTVEFSCLNPQTACAEKLIYK